MPPRKKPEPEAPEAETAQVDTAGRIAVQLDGQDYLLRPSFEAIMEIERRLRPLWELASTASRGSLTLHEMSVIVTEFMRAEGKAMADGAAGVTGYRGAKPERVAQLIYSAGMPGIGSRLMVILMGALSGGYTPEGEVKPSTGA